MTKKKEEGIAKSEPVSMELAIPLEQLAQDAKLDSGTVRAENLAKPFLRIIQKNTIDKFPNAKIGDILNTVTKEIHSGAEGILIIPIYFVQDFVEWKTDSASGSGFVATYGYEEGKRLLSLCPKNDKNRMILQNGNELADTRTHFGMQVHEDGSMTGAIIAMSRTQIKASQQWLDMMNRSVNYNGKMVNLPWWAFVYRLSSEMRSDGKYSWMVWHIEKLRPATQPEYNAAMEARQSLSDMLKSGKVDYSPDSPSEDDSIL